MPTVAQLKQAVAIAEKIEKLQAELASLVGGSSSVASAPAASISPIKSRGRRKMSAATIAKMKAAQQARWAKKKGAAVVSAVETAVEDAVKSTGKIAKKAKRKLSPEGRAKIVAALKTRWASKKKASK
jgi:hypothetical protein